VIVICANDDRAQEFAADLECLAPFAAAELAPRALRIVLFPTWDQSAYSPIAPSIRTRFARSAALRELSEGGGGLVIVTTLAASCQATMPKWLFDESLVRLEADGSIDTREAFAARLTAIGYQRVDPIEDPGTFALRGEIVDIYPPGAERPVRIELFSDIVEKIRPFDAATQRTLKDSALKSFVIPPAREVLINRETAPTLREKLKARADDQGISRGVRDPILAMVQDGMYPDHSDAWAPFAYESPGTLWEHAEGCPVLWVDELSCQQDWDQFVETQGRLAAEAQASGTIAPKVDELFRWTPALEREVKSARTRLYLDRIELVDLDQVGAPEAPEPAPAAPGTRPEDPIATSHRVFVRANSDLARGSRDSFGELEPKFKLWREQRFRVVALAATQSQAERIRFLLEERGHACLMLPKEGGEAAPGAITLATGQLSEGFRWPAEGYVFVTESEILGAKHVKKQRKRTGESASAARNWAGLQALADLAVGDAVVHIDHGIGLYRGLVRLDMDGAPSDFLQLEYANRDKLYLPVYRLNVIQKYVAAGEAVTLDKLGQQQFQKTKEKVRDAVRKLAVDLIKLYAERKITPGVVLGGRDADFQEFEAKFPFDETIDQLKSVDDILADFESGRVMDRLVCGDVGYGKTEVAMRAAFRAVSDGKQVAVLVPTTVLAYQHEQSFRARMKDYPVTIDSVSRFKSAKEQKAALDALAQGKVDIIMGTHRLLSRDVQFRDLGLIIVDEEHRFGVEHKEKLKSLKVNTHVLTLTATPIPRTLHMALSGLRDISLINTPPVDRLPIRTYVSKYDDALIQRAIGFELARGGQVFFLHNRVQSIYETASRIRELVPGALVGVAHGQMGEGELEQAMMGFYEKKTNVLVCTTIIESGLDLPSANTILINRADSLGLAQLYQIRGRVGRGQQRGYAYLLIPAEGAVSEDAKKRLEVIQRFVELGSGFSIASHDLEIRGGGDLLGPQQSGNINAVGFDLYTELLDEAIRELEGKPLTAEENAREPEIKAPFAAYLGDEYVPDVHQRLSLYRRFSAAAQESDLDLLEEELRDRFGDLPREAQNLVWMIRIKQLLKKIGVDTLTVGPEKFVLLPGPNSRLNPGRAIALLSAHPKKYQLLPDSKFVVTFRTPTLRDLFFALETLFKDLA
jgi:transcription-repair coupling factor (superfamily II helicase)